MDKHLWKPYYEWVFAKCEFVFEINLLKNVTKSLFYIVGKISYFKKLPFVMGNEDLQCKQARHVTAITFLHRIRYKTGMLMGNEDWNRPDCCSTTQPGF